MGARVFLEESLAFYREFGSEGGIALSLLHLGDAAIRAGAPAEARALYEESLALSRTVDTKRLIGWSLHGLVLDQSTPSGSVGPCGRPRTFQPDLSGGPNGISKRSPDHALGRVAHAQGDLSQARAGYRADLTIRKELGDRRGIAECLEGLAAAVAQAQSECAARLFGAAERLREAMGAPLPPADRAEHDVSVTTVRTILGEEAFTAAWQAWRALPLDEAVRIALTGPHAEACRTSAE